MATRKAPAKTPAKAKTEDETPAKDATPTEAPSGPASEAGTESGLAEQAAQIAADARALATGTQQAISDLNTRCVALLRADTGEHPASTGGVQRLPMAATDLLRALRSYGAVAAELAAAARR
ncbi:hypothetical protein E1287_07450 [Actinomadura sp. KC06]|uniref:hypothetical protein n=1 Tax=Actinomadura sp. KC06 TaxID=2530369 RepID=UPI0010525C80|nr:hypothetical protein [Actinomadura sp. KC06]TDD37883.1 hypothetical protein E1287_07450 [Actinomadura sp. KC06]